MGMVAKDLVALAANDEGLENWARAHGGSAGNPAMAAKSYATELYGDTDEANLLCLLMVKELDHALNDTVIA